MKLTKALRSMIVAAVIASALLMAPAAASARVFVSVGFAPPAIPIYAQPLAPGYGYIWTPGYWAYGPDGYYWVDGAWVLPPYDGALWTPGYWGWGDGAYLWYPGYWGLTVGYYGGINYGFGYFGTGFYGGYWHGGRFFYNGAYNHLGFHNGFVYNHPVAGFDGRPGGQAFAQHNGGAEAFNRNAGINGRSVATAQGGNFAARGASSPAESSYRNGFAGNGARPAYDGGAYNGGAASGFSRGNSPAQTRSAPAPQARTFSGGNFSAPARSAPAPQARSFSGGAQAHASFGGGGGGGGRGGGGGHR
jgi:hypothetical protein